MVSDHALLHSYPSLTVTLLREWYE